MSRANPRYHRLNPSGTPVSSTNGIVRYILQGSFQGQMSINIFDYQATVPAPTQGQLSTLRSNISTTLLTAYRLLVGSDWTVTREIAVPVHRNDIAGVVSTVNAGLAGTSGSLSLDTEIAVVIQKRTGLKGQHGRGRIGLPAVPNAVITQSTVTNASYITALNSFCTLANQTVTDGTNTWQPVVSQRSTASPRLVTNWSATTSWTASTLLGTVRRRKIGRGK